jgi:hypothetical protein
MSLKAFSFQLTLATLCEQNLQKDKTHATPQRSDDSVLNKIIVYGFKRCAAASLRKTFLIPDLPAKEDNMKKTGLMLIVLSLLASLAWAAGPSMKRGKELFNSAKLGTNGKSCATCHRDGNKLERVATYADGELGAIINQCIKNSLEGKGLDPSSSDMKSLIIYIKAFAGLGKI